MTHRHRQLIESFVDGILDEEVLHEVMQLCRECESFRCAFHETIIMHNLLSEYYRRKEKNDYLWKIIETSFKITGRNRFASRVMRRILRPSSRRFRHRIYPANKT